MERATHLSRCLSWLSENLILIVGGLAMGFVMFMLMRASMREKAEWEAFRVSHSCQIAAKVDSQLINTLGSRGTVGIGIVPSRQGWLCDDGVTYFKDE